jgi:protein-L-isoaspartate(D-aspartate) O-methyltransferase
MEDYASARRKMVDSQLRTENVTDHAILAAMGTVPRELFVAVGRRPLAYLDRDLVMREGADEGAARRLMEPARFARLVQLADLSTTDVVLDIGCGSGYSTAVLAQLSGNVTGIESDAALAALASRTLADLAIENATVVATPLEGGYPAGGPYDAILLEGAVEAVPAALFDQLRDGGRLIAVVGYGRAASAVAWTKSDGRIGKRIAFDADVPPLPGFRKPEVFVF